VAQADIRIADFVRCMEVICVMGWVMGFLVGAITGILSGFGVGGGSLLLVYLTGIAGVEQTVAQGINLLYFLPTAAAALPSHAQNGYLDKKVIIPAVLAGMVCAGVAAWIATAMEKEMLRKLFGGFLFFVGLRELFGGKKSGAD